MVKRYGNPFAVEIAIIELENGLKGSVARSFNNVAKEYIEQFDVYGTKATFEWQQINVEETPVVYTISDSTFGTKGYYTWREVGTFKVQPEDFPGDLPESLIPYLREATYREVLRPEKTYIEGGGHHGAHPFLVHDFIRSAIENRKPVCDEIIAANICAAGILAHESALQNGVLLSVPEIK
jgi:predicted dehydrogenase